jgi:hypothetical protein
MDDKTVNTSVYQGLNPSQGYYIPNFAEEPTRWYAWSVAELKEQGKKEISVQQFKDLILSTKPFVMPEKWFIRGGDNSLVRWLQHDAKGLVEYARQKHWGLRIVDGRWVANLVDNYEKSNIKYTEITFDQFFKSLHNKKDMALPLAKTGDSKPVIGYKLTKNEYREVVAVLLSKSAENTMTANPKWFEENFDKNLKEYGFNFSSDKKNVPCRILEKAGVLNLWFEPVYEFAPKLPEIKGKDGVMYKGIYENGQLIYGCARLNVDWFKSSPNRGIGSFTTTNDVLIGMEEVKAIRKYLEHHGWIK